MSLPTALYTSLLMLLWGLGLPGAAVAGKPQQFPTAEGMAYALNDFSPDGGAFVVVRQRPLHIRLDLHRTHAIALRADPRQLAEEAYRAMLWGVYRTFLHMKVQAVTVTVVLPSANGASPTLVVKATRDQALRVAKELLGVDSLEDLITDRQTWSDSMKRCRYSDHGRPGLRVCALAFDPKVITH